MNSETKIQTPKILRNPRSKEDRRKPELGSCEETSVGRRRFLCCASLFQLVSNSIHTVICCFLFCFCFFFKANCFGAIFCCLWVSGYSDLQDCVTAGRVSLLPASSLCSQSHAQLFCLQSVGPMNRAHFWHQVGGRLSQSRSGQAKS